VLLKENSLGSAPYDSISWCCKDFQHLLILATNLNFCALVVAKRCQDGVSLQIKNNVQHHNTKALPII
jgi:hypothetical protein